MRVETVDPMTRCVMSYFSCDKKMAEIIIKSSKENGEFERIKNMCTMAPSERSYQA